MKINSNTDFSLLLEFLYELNCIYDNFHEKLLYLLSKYFKYEYINFFPLYDYNSAYSLENETKIKYSTNCVALNLDNTRLNLYMNQYFQTDIFQPLNLPKPLINRPLVTITDIMPYSRYESTNFYQFLNGNGFYYEACMYLNINNLHLGTIAIFRHKSRGDFSSGDYEILKTINKYITQNYKNSVDEMRTAFKYNVLKFSQEKLSVGLLFVDNNLNIIESNQAAYVFCQEIYESVQKNTNHNKIVFSHSNNSYIQWTINYYQNQLFNAVHHNYTICANDSIFNFTITSSPVLDNFRNVKTINSICITKTKQVYDSPTAAFSDVAKCFNLTKREMEIIACIKRGYSNKEIAEKMFISNHTVKAHVMNIFAKTNVASRTELLFKLNDTNSPNS